MSADRATKVSEVTNELMRRWRLASTSEEKFLPPERELARELGASRPVIREAVGRLEVQGLVEVRHGVGLRIVNEPQRPISELVRLLVIDQREQLRQSLEARLVVEPHVARLASERATEHHLKELRRVQTASASITGPEDGIVLDLEFHRVLASASGNEIFGLMLGSIADLESDTRRISHALYGFARARRQHESILKAVESHDADRAERAMRQHLLLAVRDVQEAREAADDHGDSGDEGEREEA